MRRYLFAVGMCSLVGSIVCTTASDASAAKKSANQKSLERRHDFNQDGKISAMERAALRMTKAQQREWRAIQRNNAMVR